jgi:hypothetical protein
LSYKVLPASSLVVDVVAALGAVNPEAVGSRSKTRDDLKIILL